MATGNTDDALDILQDTMMKLVQKYAERPPEEWSPLFHTILQSRIRDYYRKNRVRNRFRVWFGGGDEDDPADPIQSLQDPSDRGPDRELDSMRGMDRLAEAVRELPLRQQQAFMLRALEGLDVAATARTMHCSEGSVKTHYSRAIHVLRDKLSDYSE
jgi:RNA polymerase sigma-70 factor (ECF subfamily)